MDWLLTMTMLVACLLVIPHLYLGWRSQIIFKYIAPESKFRFIPIAILASFYLLPLVGMVHYLIGGEPDLLKYPAFLTYWFWFGFVVTFQLFTWVILSDIIRLITKKVSNRPVSRINSFYGIIVSVLAVFLFIFTAAKMWVDTTQIDVKYITVSDKDIPNGFYDFRIVHITDLQGDEYTGGQDIAAYIDKVNSLNPDLVIFTGDLISYGTDFIDMAARELSKAKATVGLYAVIGDHDYWAGVADIKAAYRKYGVPLVQDENTVIRVDGDSLLVTGITEVYSKQISSDSLKKLASAYEGIPFEIMATHQATEKVIQSTREQNYEIVLGGHTHGGQIRVPLMFTHISAPSFETDYLSGVYHIGDLLLNINNGLGFTLAPVRYDAQPSISVIDIKPISP